MLHSWRSKFRQYQQEVVERSRNQKLYVDLVLCFCFHLCACVICNLRLKTTSFVFFTLDFFTWFQGKSLCYDHCDAVYGWQTLPRCLNYFWWAGNAKLALVNLIFVKTMFHSQQWVSHQHYMTWTTTHADYDQAKKFTRLCSCSKI